MSEITKAIRALGKAVGMQAIKVRFAAGKLGGLDPHRGQMETAASVADLLAHACREAADDLDRQWQMANAQLTGTKVCPVCVEPGIPLDASSCPKCKANLTGMAGG